jgi:hypothetical protein
MAAPMMPTYLSIGFDCTVAYWLRDRKLRRDAYPLDWVVIPVSTALTLLDNRFEGFLDPANLTFLDQEKRMLFDEAEGGLKASVDLITPVVCRRYGILFPHDFSAAGKADLPAVQQKYNRRIERLLKTLHVAESIHLVYQTGTPNAWQQEQYRLAGVTFPEETRTEIDNAFQDLNQRHTQLRLVSLADCQAAQKKRTLLDRLKPILKRHRSIDS